MDGISQNLNTNILRKLKDTNEQYHMDLPHGLNLMNGKDNIHEVDKMDYERPMTCEIQSHKWS